MAIAINIMQKKPHAHPMLFRQHPRQKRAHSYLFIALPKSTSMATMNMATPLNKLPDASNPPIETHDADEVVSAVLKDMENELATHEPQHANPLPPRQYYSQNQSPPQLAVPPQGFMASLLEPNMENLKLSACIIVLSAIAFQPNLTRVLYEKIPRLSIFETYDIFVRAVLLGVFFYVLLTYAKINVF
jgi:hypothetical protein